MAVGEHILNLIKLHFDGFKWIGLCCITIPCAILTVSHLWSHPKAFYYVQHTSPFKGIMNQKWWTDYKLIHLRYHLWIESLKGFHASWFSWVCKPSGIATVHTYSTHWCGLLNRDLHCKKGRFNHLWHIITASTSHWWGWIKEKEGCGQCGIGISRNKTKQVSWKDNQRLKEDFWWKILQIQP